MIFFYHQGILPIRVAHKEVKTSSHTLSVFMLSSIRREIFTMIGHLSAGFVYVSGIFERGGGGKVEPRLDCSTLSR